MIVRQRLGLENIERGAGEPAAVERLKQIPLDDMTTARRVD